MSRGDVGWTEERLDEQRRWRTSPAREEQVSSSQHLSLREAAFRQDQLHVLVPGNETNAHWNRSSGQKSGAVYRGEPGIIQMHTPIFQVYTLTV